MSFVSFVFKIILISLQLAIFTYHLCNRADDTKFQYHVPTDSLLIYSPHKREQLWRYIFYMLLHAGWFHLTFNLSIQLVFGLPLEMVHGTARIACIYLAGVLAGSLGTSIFDPEVYLIGASGGVYALMAAHLANVMLNYHEMRYGLLRLVTIFLLASGDVGLAIYERYAAEDKSYMASVSYVAHLTGALAGLTIGLLVLKNFEQKLHEQLLWWIALGIYTSCILFAIIYNLLYRGAKHFNLEQIPSTETIYHDFQV